MQTQGSSHPAALCLYAENPAPVSPTAFTPHFFAHFFHTPTLPLESLRHAILWPLTTHRGFILGIWVKLPAGLGPQWGTKAPTLMAMSAQGTYFHAEGANLI